MHAGRTSGSTSSRALTADRMTRTPVGIFEDKGNAGIALIPEVGRITPKLELSLNFHEILKLVGELGPLKCGSLRYTDYTGTNK